MNEWTNKRMDGGRKEVRKEGRKEQTSKRRNRGNKQTKQAKKQRQTKRQRWRPTGTRVNATSQREGTMTSVARYHGTTAAPRYHFFYGTSTVAFTVLFSTAIPQVPRFFGTVLARCWHTVMKTSLYFDWNCSLRLVFSRSPLNVRLHVLLTYFMLFCSIVYTKWVKWRH